MNKEEFTEKIKSLIKSVYSSKAKSDDAALPYDELTNFPELKGVIVDLLTSDFDKFLESIDWVAPRPSTFRINLLNGQNFLLRYGGRSWEAQVEGKNYTLINLDEEQRAAKAISRILAYGAKEQINKEEDLEYDGGEGSSGGSSSGGGGGLSGAKSTGVSRSEFEAGLGGADSEGSEDIADTNPPDEIDPLEDL